jgi:hypothetical protein
MIPVLVKSVWLRNICFSKVATTLVKCIDRLPLQETSEGGNYTFSTADVTIHASNRQIWYRHPNSEAGNDEIQNVQRESKHGFLFCGNYILKYW